jgi:hypothetical protein
MKILFLDIDGVLNSSRTATIHGTKPDGTLTGLGYPTNFSIRNMRKFDPVAIGLIRQLCYESGCQIVLSSTWRITFTVEESRKAFNLPIIDKTPRILFASRGGEIKEWLDTHSNIMKYTIVDDDSDMLESQLPYFVKVDSANGLSYQNYKQLKQLLMEK